MAHPRLGSCVKNEKGNSGRWRTERGKKERRVAGPFTMLHSRIKQRVNEQTNERRTKSEAAPHTEPLHSPTPSARPSVRRDCPTSAGGPVIKTVTHQKSKIIIVGKIYIKNPLWRSYKRSHSSLGATKTPRDFFGLACGSGSELSAATATCLISSQFTTPLGLSSRRSASLLLMLMGISRKLDGGGLRRRRPSARCLRTPVRPPSMS